MGDYAYLKGPNKQWYLWDNIIEMGEESLVKTLKIKNLINHSGKEEVTEGWLACRFGMLESLERGSCKERRPATTPFCY